MRWVNADGPADSTMGLYTTNSGGKWNPKANDRDEQEHTFRIYGTYETPDGGPVEESRYFITGVNVQLRVGPDASTRVETAVQVLNAPPEVVDP